MQFRRLTALACLAFASLFLHAAPLHAAQGTGCMPTTGTVSGLTFAQDVNAGIAALISSNSGNSAPATDCTALAIPGQLWLDTSTTPSVLKIYAGSNGWVKIGAVDNTNSVWTPPLGGGTNTLASAGTVDLCSVPQGSITVSGTTTITSLGSSCSAGQIKFLFFSGALTLTQNATSLILPGAANIVTGAGDTAVAVALGSGNWRIHLFSRANAGPAQQAIGSLASASTVDLGSIPNATIDITGTTTITAFGSSAPVGAAKFLRFAGALTLTQNATSLILPGAANIAVAAGDTAVAVHLGSGNWRVYAYQPATGKAVAGGGGVIDYQVFTTSGTWTKASGLTGNELVMVQEWGGGGAATTNGTSGGAGGGGGAFVSFEVIASSLNATESVVVASGGQTSGAAGGSSSFKGIAVNGGGGAGTGSPGAGGTVTTGVPVSLAGAAGATGVGPGTSSIYGGAGGAGNSSTPATSVFGGSATTTNGVAPGGGGSGTTPGLGARGEVRIWTIRLNSI